MSPETTLDRILRGRLVLEQPALGYRFTIDAIVLASFAEAVTAAAPARVVDLGAGCGVIGCLLATRWPATRVGLVELQAELAALAERNVLRNRLGARVQVRCEDLREGRWAAGPRPLLAVSNPPFFRPGEGRISKNPLVAASRHELAGGLDELIEVSARALQRGDSLVLIHDARRRAELLRALSAAALVPRSLREVLPLPDRPARRILVRAVPGLGTTSGREGPCLSPSGREGPVELAPLIVHDVPGRYSSELLRMLGDGNVDDGIFGQQEERV